MFDLDMEKRMTREEARGLNPLVLAYIGDSVYELFIRYNLLMRGKDKKAHKLHVEAISYVKAKAQKDIMLTLEDILSEDEIMIYKRGRNAKSKTMPRNAEVIDYKMATGFEALVGYLYLTGENDRLQEIFENITFNGGQNEN